MADVENFWDSLDPKYHLILCDIWGVVHDGFQVYPGAAERLRHLRGEGRKVVLITNAPRTNSAIEEHLARVGLPRDAWDAIAAGGQAGIDVLRNCVRPVGFLGTEDDRDILLDAGVAISPDEQFTDLACTGLPNRRGRPEDYRPRFQELVERNVVMHCLNPDRVVIHGGVMEYCAGALADLYVELGGGAEYYGKPYPAIYRYALSLAGNPPAGAVLAIGDSAQTDALGAARMGFDFVFVRSGVSAGKPFPADFASLNGLGDWRPVAAVDDLA